MDFNLRYKKYHSKKFFASLANVGHGCDDCVKWAANVWIHLYDFKAAHLQGLGG